MPVTLDELVADATACLAAGAASVHLHPRRPADGLESLAAQVCDPVVAAIRSAAPGLEISLSTSQLIALDGAAGRVEAVRRWRAPPDVVSLNLEDSLVERDGTPAPSNPDQVTRALARLHRRRRPTS